MSPSDQADPTEYTAPPPNLSGFGGRRGSSLAGLATPGGGAAARPPVARPPRRDDAAASPPATAPAAPPPPQQPAPELVAPAAPAATPPAAAAAQADQRDARASAPGAAEATADEPPGLVVDTDDPAMLVVTPTVLSVPEPLMRRFERARRDAESNTSVVLDALRAHLVDLPQLVLAARRPAPPTSFVSATEPFPWRASGRPLGRAAKVRRVQLPIRPLVGELQVIDILVGWVQQRIGASARSLGGRTTRSEVVAAALDAYLPGERRRADAARPAGARQRRNTTKTSADESGTEAG